MLEQTLDVRKDAEVVDGDRGIAFELRVAEREESERGERSVGRERGPAQVVGRGYRSPVQLRRLNKGRAPRVGRHAIFGDGGGREGECAGSKDREEIQIDSQNYGQRRQKSQAIAKNRGRGKSGHEEYGGMGAHLAKPMPKEGRMEGGKDRQTEGLTTRKSV